MLDTRSKDIHSREVCQEIGERLSSALGRTSDKLPAHLVALIERLAQREAPTDGSNRI